MKKLIIWLLCFCMLAATACARPGPSKDAETTGETKAEESTEASDSAEAAEREPLKLNLAMTASMEEHHGICWQTFADYVKEKCPWIDITIHASSTLYDESTVCEALMRGNVEMGLTSPGYIGEYAPVTSVFGACYIFDSIDHLDSVINGEVGMNVYDQVAEETGIRILGGIYKGRRTINLREDKKIESREDMNGILLRVPGGETWLDMGYALGCEPTSMALSEVYLALQSGSVDGQDNPLQATMLYGFGEVTKSITMTNHIIDFDWLAIREDIWEQLDEDTRKVFMDGVRVAYDECFAAYESEEAELIQQFRDMGVSVYDDVDTEKMAAEVWDYYWEHAEISEKWDKDVYDAIEALGK